jgi:ketosteroid isomerase-like protein
VVEWKSKTVSSSGEAKVWAGTATDIVRRQPDGTWKLALDNPYGIE